MISQLSARPPDLYDYRLCFLYIAAADAYEGGGEWTPIDSIYFLYA